MAVQIKTTDFVEASELFKDCPRAWNLFTNSDPNCSWGDNNRTLINASYIESILSLDDDHLEHLQTEIDTVLNRIKEVNGVLINGETDDFYVDLEN